MQSVIKDNYGSGIEREVTQVIKEEAGRLVREDEEIKEKIRNAVIYWINAQT